MNLKIISAGAGSGKTYSLTQEMTRLLMPQNGQPAAVRASGILATTFTNKAAAELKERVRVKLLEEGLSKEADELGNAMIGTVHAIGVQLLKRFAFEAGVSPDVDIIADDDQQTIFNQSLATILTEERTQLMESLSTRLGFKKNTAFIKDWRKDLRNITDYARANAMDTEVLKKSENYSIESFLGLLPEISKKSAEAFDKRLAYLLENTIIDVENTDDGTKSKQTLVKKLKTANTELHLRGSLYWYEWVGLAKACDKAPKKCREAVEELREFCLTHDTHPGFHDDLKAYIHHSFELAIEALKEYEEYKKSRGLIDYTDMEVMILKLLENEMVLEVLSDELDLLLVDEFQDTNPIQLKIFLKLTKISKQSIWVGDPKQSIYGFRGAAPELMQAVMNSTKNIHVLEYSWRSREDLVNSTNALFTEAFNDIPEERVALKVAAPFAKEKEDSRLQTATEHWVIDYIEGNKVPGNDWLEKAMAKALSDYLSEEHFVREKGSNEVRPLLPKDVAILCRTNSSCQKLATALHSQGIKASISRAGLLDTAEACLIHACLKYILNDQDSLSIAEIMLLMEQKKIEEIIDHRLDFLEQSERKVKYEQWGLDNKHIKELADLRPQMQEMSATEILNLVIEKLDIRRVAAAWGNAQQRFDNIDSMRSLALQYEENCNRLHNAATLGGFLLWLDELGRSAKDQQGSGADESSVNILTYHKSKGLEWPVVICYDMGKSLRENVFDVRIIAEKEEIDLDDPLANRLLCFWVNPYGGLEKNTALMDAIDAHPDRKKIRQAALDEEARLLYVGFTRARDYLIYPVVPKHRSYNYTNWLNRVFHHGQEDIPSVDPMAEVCLWSWKGEEIPVKRLLFEFPKDIPTNNNDHLDLFRYLPAYEGEEFHASAQPETPDDLFKDLEIKTKKSLPYCPPMALPEEEEIDVDGLGKLLQIFIRTDRPHYALSMREQSANYLIQQYQMEDWLNSLDLMNISNHYHKKIAQLFGKVELQNSVFFKYREGKRFFKGKLDYYLQTPKGERVLITDVMVSLEDFRKRKFRKADELGAFLYAAEQYFQQKDPIEQNYQHWLHFPLEGQLMPLDISLEKDELLEDLKNPQTKLF
jgi:ATP-dependent helicase/nuclease subunit A